MKAKDSVWYKSSMEKGEVNLVTVLILIQDGEDTAIPTRDGYLDTNYI